MTALDWADARNRRVVRSHLVKQAPKTRLVEVVREVCGLQAQLLSAAELAISARVSGLTHESVREALWTKRTLVRSWMLLIDGVVSGVWERSESGRRIEIDVRPAVKLTPAQRQAVKAEAGRIGRFFGREAVVSLT